MRMIKTYEGMTMNCDVIATIQSVFMNIATGSISEMVDDSFDPDTLEFAVTAFTTLGDEIVLVVYATEEERRQDVLAYAYREIGPELQAMELQNTINAARRSTFLKILDKWFLGR